MRVILLIYSAFLYLIATTFPVQTPGRPFDWRDGEHRDIMVKVGVCKTWDISGHLHPQWIGFEDRMEFWCGRRV